MKLFNWKRYLYCQE